jgi:hypothetical protein
MTAELRYAREPLVDGLPLEAERVLAAWREAKARLAKESTPPERFQPALMSAYKSLIARRGEAMGERVDLVDLWADVALCLQTDRFFKKPSRETFKTYPRWLYAHDLARLREEGKLSSGEWRISIGAATAGSTAQKSRVLWIEDSAGGGQYYLTFHLMRPTPAGVPDPGGPDPGKPGPGKARGGGSTP